MAARDLLAAKEAVVDRHGEWTAHNIRLGEGVYTRGPDTFDDQWRALRVVQLVEDVLGSSEGLRVLDLGCLEGLYAIEFGLRGAEAVGIEGREANVAKAAFAKEALGLERVDFRREDVRGLSAERHGRFDVVLCIGILYHLDAADVFEFADALASVCRRLLLVDTHVALSGRVTHSYRGRDYAGLTFLEHPPDATDEERERQSWASLDNTLSFWPTEPSLLRLLAAAGFTSVSEVKLPSVAGTPPDRRTYMALKGTRAELRSSPVVAVEQDVVEHPSERRPLTQRRWYPLLVRAQLARGPLLRKLRRRGEDA